VDRLSPFVGFSPRVKRVQLVALLVDSLALDDFTLLDIAEFIGHLGTATLVCRWMRPAYFLVMAWFHGLLHQRYHAIMHYKSRHRRADEFRRALPSAMAYWLSSLVSRDIAQALWTWRTKHKPTVDIRCELRRLHFSLESEKWDLYSPDDSSGSYL
jgi:hypothetical protein